MEDIRGGKDGDGSLLQELCAIAEFNGVKMPVVADIFVEEQREEELFSQGEAAFVQGFHRRNLIQLRSRYVFLCRKVF